MIIIKPKDLNEWKAIFAELDDLVSELPDVPEMEFNREMNDLVYLEDQIMLFESIDRKYTEAAIMAEVLRSTMDFWKDLRQAEAREETLNHIESYPHDKDREAAIKVATKDYTQSLSAARLMKSIVESKKRLLDRQCERLREIVNIEKKIRY